MARATCRATPFYSTAKPNEVLQIKLLKRCSQLSEYGGCRYAVTHSQCQTPLFNRHFSLLFFKNTTTKNIFVFLSYHEKVRFSLLKFSQNSLTASSAIRIKYDCDEFIKILNALGLLGRAVML